VKGDHDIHIVHQVYLYLLIKPQGAILIIKPLALFYLEFYACSTQHTIILQKIIFISRSLNVNRRLAD